MGRFWDGLANFGRKVGNIAGTVGKVAGLLSGIPVIGGVASTVANVANTVNKVANAGVGMIEQGQQIASGNGSPAEKIVNTGKAIYNTADKMSGGAISKGVNQAVNQGKQAINQMANSQGPVRTTTIRF